MTEKTVPLTKEGLSKLEEELKYLCTVRRSQVASRILQAKELTSTQNNPEYEDAKNEQAFVEGRILTLENILQNAIVIDEEEAHRSRHVRLGSTVVVMNHRDNQVQEYTIVGSAEVDASRGRISNESPVGRALLGKQVGDEVQISVPAGICRLTIINIR